MEDEQITVSPIGQPDQKQSYSRQQFYDEQFGSADKPALSVHVVAVFIVTSSGEVVLQKRAANKRHNPGLIDKSLGGHISYGDEADYTVMVETVQELLTPSIVMRNEADFKKTHGLLKSYLNTVALIKHDEVAEVGLTKIADGQKHQVSNVMHVYFGIYNGSTKPADREAAGMLYYGIEDIDQELQATPDQFTDDLKQLFPKYKQALSDFIRDYSR